MVVAVILVVIVIVVAVAIVVLAQPDENTEGNEPSPDDIAEIAVHASVGNFDNQWGKVKVEGFRCDATVTPFDYGKYDGKGFWDFLDPGSFVDNEFEVVLAVRCTGPHGFAHMAWDTQHVTVDEWHEFWSWGAKYSISFDELKWFVSEPGVYRFEIEVVVSEGDQEKDLFDALQDGLLPGEGVNEDLAHSCMRSVTVNEDGTGG